MKRFKITEEQYKAFNESKRLNEDEKENPKLSVTADSSNPEQVQKATEKAKNATNKLGEPVDIKLDNKRNSMQLVNCSRIITKKQLKENILSRLKKNSKVYSASDFLKKL